MRDYNTILKGAAGVQKPGTRAARDDARHGAVGEAAENPGDLATSRNADIASVQAWLDAFRAGKPCVTLGQKAMAAIARSSRREVNPDLSKRLAALTGKGKPLKLKVIADRMGLTLSALSQVRKGQMGLTLPNAEKLNEILARYE